MSLNLSADTHTYELPPSGSLPARCCHIIDLGTQTVEYQGTTKKLHKIAIAWQLEETRADGTPFIVGRRFTASLHEKANLRQFLESWRGRPFSSDELKGFAMPRLINVPALLNIVHTERGTGTYAEIKSIAPIPRGMSAPREVSEPIVFDLGDPNTWHVFERLSQRQQEAIEASPEWQNRLVKQPETESAAFDDELAF